MVNKMNDKNEYVPSENESLKMDGETISADGTLDGDVDIQELFRKYLDSDSPLSDDDAVLQFDDLSEEEAADAAAEVSSLLSRLKDMTLDDYDDALADEDEPVAEDDAQWSDDEEIAVGESSDEAAEETEEEASFDETEAEDGAEYAAAEYEETVNEEEEIPSAYEEETPGEEDIDDTDINLMVAFGMDDELDRKVGSEAADMIRDHMSDAPYQAVREPVEFEFTDRSQISGIASAYKSAHRWTVVKLLVAIALTGYLLFYENIALFGIQFSGALDPHLYPVVYVMVALQIGLLACACAYEQIFKGFRRLFSGHPSAETVPAVMAVVNVIYSAVVAVMAGSSDAEIQLFNAPVAMSAVFVLIHELLGIRREMFSFNVIASKKPKYVMRRIEAQDAQEERQAFRVDSAVLKIEKTDFVDGFFSRVCTSDRQNSSVIGFLSVVIPLAAVLLAVIAAYVNGGVSPYWAAGMTFTAAYPMSLLLTGALPFFKAAKYAYKNDSAIIGECSLEEYAYENIVSLEESVVYPSGGVKVQNIKVFNNYRIDKVLYFASSIFRRTGGPLKDVFEAATVDIGHSDEVELLRCETGILSASVDGRTVTFGKANQLLDAGFPDVFPEEELEENDELSVMYMFRDEILVAEMYVRYRMDEEFESLLSDLASGGMNVCIRSFDPNIDEELLSKKVNVEECPLRVVKMKDLAAAAETQEHIDSGIVTRGAPENLLNTQPYCGAILYVRQTVERLVWLGVLLTLALSAVLLLTGTAGYVRSLVVCAYQLVWMLPALIATRVHVR